MKIDPSVKSPRNLENIREIQRKKAEKAEDFALEKDKGAVEDKKGIEAKKMDSALLEAIKKEMDGKKLEQDETGREKFIELAVDRIIREKLSPEVLDEKGLSEMKDRIKDFVGKDPEMTSKITKILNQLSSIENL